MWRNIWSRIRRYSSEIQFFLITVFLIFATEFAVMLFLGEIRPETASTAALLDAFALVFLISPVLFFLLFRPLIRQVRERRKAEAELRRQGERTERYLDIAGVMLLVLDTAGRVSMINKRGCEVLGFDEADIVGRDWFETFVEPEMKEDARRVFLKMLSGSEVGVESNEGPLVARGGARKTVLWHNRLLREDGRITGVLRSGEDITELKEASSALVESETRYRLLHDTAFDAIIISDAKDRVVECNPSAERIFGYAEGTMLGMSVDSLMPVRFRDRHRRGLARFMETGSSRIQGMVLEMEGLRSTGEVFPIELVLSSFHMADDTFFTGTIRDITEKRRAEDERNMIQEQLNQVQKMEAIGKLAGGIAHDFNNMLAAIRGNAELAMEDAASDEPVYSRLKEINLSVVHASKLTRQLLLFSRKQPLRLFPQDINKAVDGILPIITRLLGENIRVEVSLADDLWTVRADESNIEQVLMNLAVNARDAMGGGGTIHISTENREFYARDIAGIEGARPGMAVCFTVRDTGPGISEEARHRIFEPFYSTKGPGKGTGLGLSVVYGIVKQHHGWITVNNHPEGGAMFRICLPAIPGVLEHEAGEMEVSTPAGHGENVVLAMEDRKLSALTARTLVENGYSVLEAEGVEAALEMIEGEGKRPDLLLCDSRPGGGDWLEMVGHLRDAYPGMPVLLVAGADEIDARTTEITGTGADLLEKPYSIASLLNSVSRALRGSVAAGGTESGNNGMG